MTEEILIRENSTIPQVLKDRITLHPDQEVVVEGDEYLTYLEFGERVDQLAAGLHQLGVQPGEKVAIVLPNCIEFPVIIFAVAQIGAVNVAVNPYLRPAEFTHILNDSEAVALIVTEEIYGADPLTIIREIRSELSHLRYLIVNGEAAEGEIEYSALAQPTGAESSPYQPVPDDIASLFYTSGTTGLPKGSIYTHRTLLRLPDFISPYMPLPIYTFLNTAPPYTAAGAIFGYFTFLHGIKAVMLERFTPYETIKLIEKERINTIFLPPTAATFILQHPELPMYDTSSLVFIVSGGSFVSKALVQEIREKLGCSTMIGFGQTEAGIVSNTDPFNDPYWVIEETVGKAVPGYEIRIVDDERQPLPADEVGEIAVRGPSGMVGYYKAEELTRETIDEDGWCYTGDLGTMDEDGYLRIVGRKKDMIIRGGVNIYPAELEGVMVAHPKIQLVTVVGVPDKIAGEKVVALVIPKEGEMLSESEVLAFCRANMAHYKVPNEVKFVDEFPLNAMRKVLKYVIREQLIAEIA